MPLWGFLLSFLTAAMWASAPIIVNRGFVRSNCSVHEINPFRAVSFLAASFVLALVSGGGTITVVTSPRAWFYFFMSVISCYTLGDSFNYLAMNEIGVVLSISVAYSYPMLVVFTSWLILGEPVTIKLLLGVAVVVAGILLLRFGERGFNSGEKTRFSARRFMRGFSFALAASLCWAVSSPLTKLSIESSGLNAVETTFYRSVAFFIATVFYRILIVKCRPASIKPLVSIPVSASLYFMGAAVIGLALGSATYARCISVMPVAVVTAIASTSPLIAALYGCFVLKEKLSGLQWAGVAMIIAGSVTVAV